MPRQRERVPAGALRHHDDRVAFAARVGRVQLVRHRVGAHLHLGDDDHLGAPRDARRQGEIAAVPPHHFDQEGALV